MTQPKFDPTITLGHLMQVLVIGVAVIGFWFGLSYRLDSVESRMNSVDKLAEGVINNQRAIDKSNVYVEGLAGTTTELKRTNAAILEQLSLIRETLAAIRGAELPRGRQP